MTDPAAPKRLVARLTLALALVPVAAGAIVARHLDVAARRTSPRSSSLAMSQDGRFLLATADELATADGRGTRRVHLIDLENPLDRWLGARRSLVIGAGEALESAPSLTRLCLVDEKRRTSRVVSFETGDASLLPSCRVVAVNATADLFVTRPTWIHRDGLLRGVADYEVRRLSRPAALVARFAGLQAPPRFTADGRIFLANAGPLVALDARTWSVRFTTSIDSLDIGLVVDATGDAWDVWETEPRRAERYSPGNQGSTGSIALDAGESLVAVALDGRRLVTRPGGAPREIAIRDALTDRPPLLRIETTSFAVSGGGPWLAYVDRDGACRCVKIP